MTKTKNTIRTLADLKRTLVPGTLLDLKHLQTYWSPGIRPISAVYSTKFSLATKKPTPENPDRVVNSYADFPKSSELTILDDKNFIIRAPWFIEGKERIVDLLHYRICDSYDDTEWPVFSTTPTSPFEEPWKATKAFSEGNPSTPEALAEEKTLLTQTAPIILEEPTCMETNVASHLKPLKGHISPDTAYIVDDYPYGYQLRCKMRIWIECNRTKGFRCLRQTTNPKKSTDTNLVWNKPKASTYVKIAMGMYLDDNDHVQTASLNEYSSCGEAEVFKEEWGFCLSEEALIKLNTWIVLKKKYEQAVKDGHVKFLINGKEVSDTTTKEIMED